MSDNMSLASSYKYFKNQEYKKAIDIWKRFPRDPIALSWIAACYRDGTGVEQSIETSIEYFMKSFEINNNILSAHELIYISAFILNNIEIDEIMIIYNMIPNNFPDNNNTCELYSHIQNYIGNYYYRIHDYTKAYLWYNKSYNTFKYKGNILRLAECYRYGRGASKNHETALTYYNKYLCFDDIDYKDDVILIVDSYKSNGTADYDNSIKCKIELIIFLLMDITVSSEIKLPKELAKIIGEYIYSNHIIKFEIDINKFNEI